MKVEEIKKDGLKREYKITVDAKTINASMEKQLKAMAGRIKIPGFRPGHVPMNVMQQRYGETVKGEVLERQINQSAQQVMKDKNLRPAVPAKVDVSNYKENGELEFTIKLEVLPVVPEVEYGKIEIEKPVYPVAEKDIEEGITRLAERNKKLARREKGVKAKKGDVLVIDFEGKIDGVAFEGGTAQGARLELGSRQFIDGFEDQLIGAKEGDDVLVKVPFPKDYHKEDLAGKAAQFAVKVHEIHEASVPELDDEFAKMSGFETLAKLRDAVRDQFSSDYDQIARTRMKKQLFDYLEEHCEFEVPQAMLEMEFESIWKKIEQAKEQGDEELKGKTDAELQTEYRKIAERRVRLGLILSDIGNRNKLTVNKDELSQVLMQQARMFPGQEKKVYDFYQKNPDQLEDLRGPILEDKAVDFIFGKAKVKETKVSMAELMAPESDGDKKKAADKKSKKKAANG